MVISYKFSIAKGKITIENTMLTFNDLVRRGFIMIKGIGIDMIELDRIKKAIQRNASFAERILTESELSTYHLLNGHRSVEFLAGRFAAKEAYAKARGTGIGKLSWQDICVQKSTEGAPYIETKEENEIVHISISHTKQHAVAQIIIECSSS